MRLVVDEGKGGKILWVHAVHPKARKLFASSRRVASLFPWKPFLGRNVPKDRIPRRYTNQGVTNLFRNDLPGGWRLLHTVIEVDGEQAVIELDALSHPAYDRLFGYAGR